MRLYVALFSLLKAKLCPGLHATCQSTPFTKALPFLCAVSVSFKKPAQPEAAHTDSAASSYGLQRPHPPARAPCNGLCAGSSVCLHCLPARLQPNPY